MEKIKINNDLEDFYIKELKVFFKINKSSYKYIAKIVKKICGKSFKYLLVAKPNELKEIVLNNSSYFINSREKESLLSLYENFRSRVISKKLITKINIKVCPYCNRNYIFNFNKNNKVEATAQLDHFYDKSTYPYLAISLYNLIPSCSTCNLRKSKNNKDIFHPYSESFNQSAKFVYNGIATQPKNKSLDFFDIERIKLNLEAKQESEKVNSHKSVFNLENLYENHKDIVKELLQKSQIYNKSYLDELEQQFGDGRVFTNRDELLRLVTGGYGTDEEINQRPLSKLIKDISEQLDIR